MHAHLRPCLRGAHIPHVDAVNLRADRDRRTRFASEVERSRDEAAHQNEDDQDGDEWEPLAPPLRRRAFRPQAVGDRFFEAVDPHPLRGIAHRPQSTSRSRHPVALR